jgi:hypothetical protein
MTSDVLADMARNHPRVGVKTSTSRKADNETNGLSLVKFSR